MKPFTVQPTPNPNSLKFTSTGPPFIAQGLLACSNPTEASEHPLSAELFGIEGIYSVLILPPFTTVTKRPEADWNEILPRVEGILEAHLIP